MGGEQDAQRDRKREHPLTHWHPRDDAVDQMSSGLRHAPRRDVRMNQGSDLAFVGSLVFPMGLFRPWVFLNRR